MGFGGDGSGDGDALFLAAAELGGFFVGVIVEVEAFEGVAGEGCGVGGGEAVDFFEGEDEVGESGEVGEKVKGLEDHPELAAVEAKLIFVGEVEGDAVEDEGTGVWGF